MFRTAMCPSSGELIVTIRHLVYVTLYRRQFDVQVWIRLRLIQTCTPNSHLYRVTYTRCRTDTINSPDNGHMAARNMQRMEIWCDIFINCNLVVTRWQYTFTLKQYLEQHK